MKLGWAIINVRGDYKEIEGQNMFSLEVGFAEDAALKAEAKAEAEARRDAHRELVRSRRDRVDPVALWTDRVFFCLGLAFYGPAGLVMLILCIVYTKSNDIGGGSILYGGRVDKEGDNSKPEGN